MSKLDLEFFVNVLGEIKVGEDNVNAILVFHKEDRAHNIIARLAFCKSGIEVTTKAGDGHTIALFPGDVDVFELRPQISKAFDETADFYIEISPAIDEIEEALTAGKKGEIDIEALKEAVFGVGSREVH